jgi:hypothetical protein
MKNPFINQDENEKFLSKIIVSKLKSLYLYLRIFYLFLSTLYKSYLFIIISQDINYYNSVLEWWNMVLNKHSIDLNRLPLEMR